MAVMQTMPGPGTIGPRSASGRARRDGGKPRVASTAAVEEALDEATRALIHRRWRSGFAIDVLAEQFHLSRSDVERVINEVRARRLLETRLEFMGDPSFDDLAAVDEILGPPPEPGSDSRRPPAPQGVPTYLASLYEIPLLSREEERFLFRKMNYLKYRAQQLRAALDPARCDAATLDEIERLQAEALAIKNRIIRANLRLVVSIARKYAGPTNNLFELISDGNMSLIRAVEKFDAARGFKFSTYATWAIAKNFAREIPKERLRHARFVNGGAELFDRTADDRGDPDQEESDHRGHQEVVRELLGELNDRERRILISRYGLGEAGPQTLEQIGRELRITKERVRQLEARARERLRRVAIERRIDPPGD